MSEWIYPTAFSRWSSEEFAAIKRVQTSGRWTAGPEVEAFEDEFARFHGRKYGIMTNSGSSANLVAMNAVNLSLLPRIFVPAIAWSTTYAPLAQRNIDMLIADVDDSWNAPLKTNYGVDAIVGCSVLGNPTYLQAYRNIADEWKIPFIEDNAESLGAITPEGKLTGTYGDLSTFSFFYSHQISAIEGGMILTDDNELAKKCRLLVNHGNAGWGNPDFEKQYDFVEFGYNVRGLELHAAIARAQLGKLTTMQFERINNLMHFWDYASDLPIKAPQTIPGSVISPFGIAFECENRECRSRLAQAFRAAGIDCRPPTGGSFLKHTYGAPWRSQKTPNADRLHDTAMFIGLAPYPIPDLIEKAVKVIKDTL